MKRQISQSDRAENRDQKDESDREDTGRDVQSSENALPPRVPGDKFGGPFGIKTRRIRIRTG